jgi:hypothetical protein
MFSLSRIAILMIHLYVLILLVSIGSHFAIAIATVNGLITARFKWDFGFLAALGAGCGEHLAWGSVTAVAVAFCLPCLTAFRASLGLVGVAF